MVVEVIGMEELKFQDSAVLEVTYIGVGKFCAPAHIGHKRTAEAIKVISFFMALLSINVVGNSQILNEVCKVGMPIDSSIWDNKKPLRRVVSKTQHLVIQI